MGVCAIVVLGRIVSGEYADVCRDRGEVSRSVLTGSVRLYGRAGVAVLCGSSRSSVLVKGGMCDVLWVGLAAAFLGDCF